jgi:hypothetical protein
VNLFPPATTPASASGPSKEEVAHKKLPVTASCVVRVYVPLSGAKTVGGSSALAAMELSRFSRDKKVHDHLPKLARFAFRILSFLMPFPHHTYPSHLSFWSTIGNGLLLLPDSAQRDAASSERVLAKGASAWMDKEPAKSCSSCII